MALPYKFNFRNTALYVTDGAGETYVIPGDVYTGSALRDGITFGWETAVGCRDRSTATPSLAGMAFNETNNIDTFRVDLAADNYVIRFALGDPSSGIGFATLKAEVFDNATSRLAITSSTSTADHFLDPANTEHTSAANWIANNAPSASISIASGIFRIKIGNNAGTVTGVISHLEIASAASYVSSFSKPLWPMSFF